MKMKAMHVFILNKLIIGTFILLGIGQTALSGVYDVVVTSGCDWSPGFHSIGILRK